MIYYNPKTGQRKTLGGGDVNAQARELEAAGWVRKSPEPFEVEQTVSAPPKTKAVETKKRPVKSAGTASKKTSPKK